MRDKDTSGLGAGFQTCRDIHTVSEHIVCGHDHVAEIYSDTKLEALVPRTPGIPGPNRILELQREPHRPRGAAEFGQEPVAGILDYPGRMSGYPGLDDRPVDGGQPRVGASLVCRHEPCVINGVSGKNDGQS